MAARGYTSSNATDSSGRRKYLPQPQVGKRLPKRPGGGGAHFEPPQSRSSEQPPRVKTKRFYPRKMRAPPAPRNTTSFLIRMKSGGLASLVSQISPAILMTPVISPAPRYPEDLVHEVNREWGVNGYGSMNGLIRLRSMQGAKRFDSQDTPAESVLQLEHRIDQILYPSPSDNGGGRQVRMTDLESRIAHLEEEAYLLRLQWMQLWDEELEESRRRLHLDGRDDDDNTVMCRGVAAGEDGVSCA